MQKLKNEARPKFTGSYKTKACIYVCMYMYVCMHVCIGVCMYVCICMFVSIFVRIYVCRCMYVCK